MPRNLNQRSFKYNCLEPQCTGITILDSNWQEHLEEIHPNNDPTKIKFNKVQYKIGSSEFWQAIPIGSEMWNNSFLSTSLPQSENDNQDFNCESESPSNIHEGSMNRSVFLGDFNGEIDGSNISEETIPNSKNDPIYPNMTQMEISPSSNSITTSVLNHIVKSEANSNVDPNDPYILIQQKINPSIISHHLKLGPMQPSSGDYQYPKTHRPTSDSLLCFNPTWFERKLADGSSQPRPWLSYSKCLNRAFCIYCILFGNSAKVSESWTKTGWDTWNNGSRDIKRHEESPQHRAAELAKVKAMSGFHSQHNSLFQVSANSEVIENRKIVKTVIDFIKHSASLQLNGERITDSFSKIVQLVSRYDTGLANTIDKLRTLSDQELNFLSIQNQKRLVSAISETIAERLVMLVKRRRSYMLVLDVVSSQGSVDKDGYGLAIWIRYLAGDSANETRVVQSLLEVVTLSSGENIEEKVIKILRRLGLDPTNMVTFCCHSSAPEMFLSQLAQVWGWPQNNDMMAFVLESGCSNCPSLGACLGLVHQLASFWTSSSARERFFCEFLERTPGTMTTTSLDVMLDLLVDRYAEMIDALAELRATISLSPLEAWTADSLWRGLKESETEEGVQLLRKAVGMMRPALTCQQLVRVHFLRQMKTRLKVEIENLENSIDKMSGNQMNGSPLRKIFRPDIKTRTISSREEYFTFLSNVYKMISDSYSDLHLQLLSEILNFSGSNLDESSTPGILNEHSITSVCQLAKVDPRSVVREMTDFQPIYKEHKAAVLDCSTMGTANIPVFPGTNSASSNQSPTILDPFLTPLKLVTEFTSFPSLLTVYKMLAVLPTSIKNTWQIQKQIVHNSLRTNNLLDEFHHCSLMLVSLEDQDDDSSYLPEDVIIDKMASCSASLRKALSLPR